MSGESRGSLRWIQRAVNAHADLLDPAILRRLPGATSIEWVSPLTGDDHAEYRDAGFLHRLGVHDLDDALSAFWPAGGPRWDALARSDRGDLLLIEAKAHVGELFGGGCQPGPASRTRIAERLDALATDLGALPDRIDWTGPLYQLANRLAHLAFLRDQGGPPG